MSSPSSSTTSDLYSIDLDIVPDLSTETFIQCQKRLTARCGLPCKFLSDNWMTFKAMVNNKEVQKHLSSVGVEWQFNI